MQPRETVREKLGRIVEDWESIPIRIKQGGKWRAVMLSEVKSEAEVARAIIGWLAPYILGGPDPEPEDDEIARLRRLVPKS